jgi:hypothetical protein
VADGKYGQFVNHFLDSICTPRNSGIVTCLAGFSMTGFASFALLMILLQRMMFALLPPVPQDRQGILFTTGMNAVHGIWMIYMPLMLAGGVVFIVTGYRLLYGSELARRIAQTNAVLGYFWLAAYAISCYRVLPIFEEEMFSHSPFPFPKAFGLISVVGTTMIAALIPTGLLLVLSRVRHNDR